MQDEYNALREAAKLIGEARRQVGLEDGYNYTSPAWKMLHHALRHIEARATELFYGDIQP